MPIFGVKSSFLEFGILAVQKRELIIEEVHIKKVTGENFSGYVTRLRMHKADGLLREGKYSVREVAEMVAFSDPFYFSKVYKKYYGYLPTERI